MISSNRRNPYFTIGSMIIITEIVSWVLLQPTTNFSNIAILSFFLVLNTLLVLFYMWQVRSERTTLHHAANNYINRLKSVSNLEAKQQIVDNMLAFDLLAKADLSGTELSSIQLSKANLSHSDLTASKQVGIRLSQANFRKSNLSYANLNYATMDGSNFSKANLYGAVIDKSDLRGCDFTEADLRGASLQDSDLSGANMSGACLRYSNLQYANLYGADFKDADLSHCVMPDGSMWSSDTNMSKFIEETNEVNWIDIRMTNSVYSMFKKHLLRDTLK